MFLVAPTIASLVFSQDEKPAPDLEAARTYIPEVLEFPEFSPRAPLVVKVLPQVRIEASVTVPAKNSRTTITIQRGEASTVPDLPPPAKPVPSEQPQELTLDQIAEIKWQRQHSLSLGATVFNHKISQVQWTDQETGRSYQAWCGFDVSLLAGLGGFVHKGEDYQFFLMHSSVETEKLDKATIKELGIPEITSGQILITQGNATDPAATAPLRVIQDVITADKQRLLTYQEAREKYQQKCAEWHKAHPPVPRDETFIFRPHRGSRYLANSKPEQKGGIR